MMDCAIICVLSMMVQMKPHADNLKCSYCINVDALTTDCYNDPLSCWSTAPDNLLYCLTSIEYRPDVALKTRRCVAQPTFPMDKQILQQAMQQRPICDFSAAQSCNCSSCVAPPPTTPRPFKPQYPPPRLSPPSRNRPKTLAINLGQSSKKGERYLIPSSLVDSNEKAHQLRALPEDSPNATSRSSVLGSLLGSLLPLLLYRVV